MLDLVKGFFGNIFGKIAMGLLVAACILAYVFYTQQQSTQKDLNQKVEENGRLTSQVSELQKTLEDKGKSDQVTEKTEDKNRKEIVYVEKKGADIQKEVDRRVAEIIAKYKESNQPQTPEVQTQQATEISTARIDGLWKGYCEAVPDNTSCASVVPPATAASQPEKTQ